MLEFNKNSNLPPNSRRKLQKTKYLRKGLLECEGKYQFLSNSYIAFDNSNAMFKLLMIFQNVMIFLHVIVYSK